MDSDTDDVCATDLGTYQGSCDMSKKVCELYARELLDRGNITAAFDVLQEITVAENAPCASTLCERF